MCSLEQWRPQHPDLQRVIGEALDQPVVLLHETGFLGAARPRLK